MDKTELAISQASANNPWGGRPKELRSDRQAGYRKPASTFEPNGNLRRFLRSQPTAYNSELIVALSARDAAPSGTVPVLRELRCLGRVASVHFVPAGL